jgi:amino acid adenylation domain-containing protein
MLQTIANGIEMAAVQKRIWQLRQRYHRSFTTGIRLQVNGPLDKELLFSSLSAITDRHGIFRTEYKFIDTTLAYPFQVVADTNLYPSFEFIDLSAKERKEQEQQIRSTWQAQFAGTAAQPGFLNAILIKQDAKTHTLIITAPALSADTNSLVNISRELFESYATGTVDEGSTEDVLQFAQFAEWHNDVLAQQDNDAKRFWENRIKYLSTAPLPLEDAGENASDRFEISIAEINEFDYKALTAWCRNNNYTTEDFLLAAWSLLLWHYTGQRENLLLGKQIAGRTLEDFNAICGPFSKTVPFLVNIRKESAFEQVCRSVQQESALVNDWQDNFNWKAGENNTLPACALQFDYTTTAARSFDAGKLNVQYAAMQSAADWFRLRLTCTDYSDSMQLAIEANTAFFSTDALQCIREQFIYLVTKLLSNEQQPAAALFTISPWEKDRVLGTFNATQKGTAPAASIIGYIEQQARQNPDHTALQCGTEKLTYGQLNERAGQWAGYLSGTCGIGRGDIVAVNLERSVQQLVCITGVLKTGAAYLPLDHAIPAERLRFILEDSNAKAIITGRELTAEQASGARVIAAAATDNSIRNNKYKLTGIERNADDIFYVIYTSGSTGKPKGVLVPDRAIINYSWWFSTDHHVTSQDSSVLFSSIAFDLSYTSLWPVLISGAALHIVEEMPVFDADHLLELLVREKITYIKLTPSHFNLLINSTQFSVKAPQLALRLVVLGGEPTRVNDIAYYLQYKNDTEFLNHYGPTEATIGVITHRINAARLDRFQQKPLIGKPTFNNRVYIVNENGEMVPFGVLGEICVAGKNITNGYLRQPGLTAQKFIPDTFTGEGTMYRTGDLGRRTPGGDIEFFGRKDFQVKVNGYRIELEEIEQTLLKYKNIARAFVTVSKDEKSLVAFITSNEPVQVTDLKKFLGLHLPDYMVPGTINQLTQFPLLPNGKIDRTTLLNTSFMKPVNDDYVAPATELEQHLAALWQEALETEQVSVNDNFFDIGGNSFKLVKVFREFSKKYPGVISLTDLFKYSTIRSLADFIGDTKQANKEDKQNAFSFEV